jgi:ketosteroid isomerase-like protein
LPGHGALATTLLRSRAVSRATYTTPQDAEAAFYEAIERADLDAMLAIWAEDEEVLCVHPGGPRLSGFEQVRASWTQIFRSRQRLQIQISNAVYVQGMMLSIHSVHENITVVGEQGPRPTVVTTNVYIRTGSGWRMLVHHASPAPQAPGPAEGSKILH